MKFSIVVTHYNEPQEIMVPLLESIQMQYRFPLDQVEVIIVNDGHENGIDIAKFRHYDFSIRYFEIDKATVSAARNKGLDEATGDYVAFCDCDDRYYIPLAFWIVDRETQNDGGFDVLIDNFFEELYFKDGNRYDYTQHNMDQTFIHGKFFRRQYLKDNNIRHGDKLWPHEDSYFVLLAMNCTENSKLCSMPYYLWCWNDASVCRRDPLYILKTFKNLIESNSCLVEEFKAREKEDKAILFVTSMIVDSWLLLQKKEWLAGQNKKYRETVISEMKKYVKKYDDLFYKCPEQQFNQIVMGQKQRYFQEQMYIEEMTWKEYKKLIGLK